MIKKIVRAIAGIGVELLSFFMLIVLGFLISWLFRQPIKL
jgi:hypothetical protein